MTCVSVIRARTVPEDFGGIMAISNVCESCFREFRLDVKSCPGCERKVSRDKRKFRVRVKVGQFRESAFVDGLQVDAETREEEIKQALKAKTGIIRDHTLADVWALYLADYSTRGKPYAIRAETNRYRELLKPRFGDMRLDKIAPSDVDRMKIELSEKKTKYKKPYAAKTILHALQLLNRLFRFAIRQRIHAGYNPVSAVTLPKVNNVIVRYLEDEQITALLSTLDTYRDQNTANLVRFLTFTGCRRGEAFKLEWRDVDLVNARVHLRDPKGGLDVHLPLNASALETLKDQQRRKKIGAVLVFPSKAGTLRRHFKEPWNEIRRLAGLPEDFRVHDLRHNYASRLASSGAVDLNTLQALLTHKDNRTTQRYAHLHPSALKAGAAVFDQVIAKARTKREEPNRIAELDEARRRRPA